MEALTKPDRAAALGDRASAIRGSDASVVLRVVLLVYCAFVFFWNLGAAPLVDVDEGAFSEATREMLARGDFITTYLNGELRFDKPILTYWLQAIPVSVFGPVEWAFRLPSALAASLWTFLLYRFARREAPEASLMAPFMLASAIGPLLIARAATADALLNAFIAGSLFAFYSFLAHGRRADLIVAFAWTALGVLTKGPVAVVVPALTVLLFCVSGREWKRPFALLGDPIAWLVFLAIVLPWYLLELRAQGQAFIDGFFLKHNVNRYTSTMLGHGGHLWYYVVALPLVVFPFVTPLVAAIVEARRSWSGDLERFAWCAFATVFVFFSVSRTQLPHYLLYGMSPLFLLLALHRHRFAGTAAQVVPAVIGIALIALIPAIATRASQGTGNALGKVLLSELPAAMAPVAIAAAGAAAILVVLAIAVSRTRGAWRTDAALYAAGAVPAVLIVAVFWPAAVTWNQAPIVAAAKASRGLNETIVEWNTNWPSFSVYRQAATPVRKPQPGEVVLTRADRLDALPRHEIVFHQREVVLARILASGVQ